MKQEQIRDIVQYFIEVFTNGMTVIKPIKNDPYDQSELTFDERFHAWQKAFEFPKELNIRMADFADNIAYGGNDIRNELLSDMKILPKFTNDLNQVLNSGKFNEYMKITKPKLSEKDPNRNNKIKAWHNSFNVVGILQNFVDTVKNAIDHSGRGYITGTGHNIYVKHLISALERT